MCKRHRLDDGGFNVLMCSVTDLMVVLPLELEQAVEGKNQDMLNAGRGT